jgi:hypothetical protein
MIIFLPIIYVEAPPSYVNEWEMDIYKDVGAADEDPWIADAWDYMDPEPTTTILNPEFFYQAPEYFEIRWINFYTIEDGVYHWFGNVGEEGTCFVGDLCYAQGKDWLRLSSNLDIDVIMIKLKPLCSTCFPSKPPAIP